MPEGNTISSFLKVNIQMKIIMNISYYSYGK